jgi:acyl-CoA thioester hydrolase
MLQRGNETAIIIVEPTFPRHPMMNASSTEANLKGPLLQQSLVPIRWGDMDAMGHVNNIIYLQYCEQCRVDWKTRLGGLLDSSRQGMIVKKASMTYHRPLVYPGTVEVRMFAAHIGRTSFSQLYELRADGQGEELWAEAEFVVVWFDYASKAPAPIPANIRKVLEGRG